MSLKKEENYCVIKEKKEVMELLKDIKQKSLYLYNLVNQEVLEEEIAKEYLGDITEGIEKINDKINN